ncbi:MAG: UTP--GlnB [Fibrobacterota bacterium]|jgi:[protein-PII] uridylyltransferase
MNQTVQALRRAYFLTKDPTQRLNAVRQILSEERQRIEISFRAYPHGTSTAQAQTDLVDLLIRTHFEARRNHTAAAGELALVAVGGTGRREMCPQSDIDLLILVPKKARSEVLAEAEAALYPLWDLGYAVGQSVRTVEDALSASERDVETYTSFLQERLIAGNFGLYRQFVESVLERPSTRRQRDLIARKLEERQKRLDGQGGLAQMLEPNLKEGRGCLRDIHTLVWLGGIQHGARGLDDLARAGIILPEEVDEVRTANEFFLRARIALHYTLGKKTDRLDFATQADVAQVLGYQDGAKGSAVERFQRDFYRHVRLVDTLTSNYVGKLSEGRTRQKPKGPTDTRFRVKDGFVELPFDGVSPFLGNLELVLDLYAQAQETGAPINPQTRWHAQQAVSLLTPEEVDRVRLLPRLLAISRHPKASETGLRDLHRIGALKLIVPDFGLIDCHSQHDVYHVYTTDEHTLTVLERLAGLSSTTEPLLIPLREELAKIQDLEVLHLAAMYHDIGKGIPGNHSITGAKLVLQYAQAAGWSEARASQAADLVKHHLLLNHIAQRRDLDDDKTIRDLLTDLSDENLLRKLFVLTWADISSVHPDAWNDWKAHLLYKLYDRGQAELSGDVGLQADSGTRRVLLVSSLSEEERPLLLEHLTRLPRRYASQVSTHEAMEHLKLVQSLGGGRSVAVRVADRGSHFDVAVVSPDRQGLLARICAGLSQAHLSIATAQVYTRVDGVVIDLFSVMPLGVDRPSVEDLTKKLEASIGQMRGQDDKGLHERMDAYVSRWSASFRRIMTPEIHVSFNDQVSDEYTVLDVTAPDRLGLMFALTAFFAEHGWVIHTARILTEADRAIDSFYLTMVDGRRIPVGPERDAAAQALHKLLGVHS